MSGPVGVTDCLQTARSRALCSTPFQGGFCLFSDFSRTQFFAPVIRTCEFCVLLFPRSQAYFGTRLLQEEEESCATSKIRGL